MTKTDWIKVIIVILVLIGIGYVMGRVHNLERAGGGLITYCINLEWEHNTLKKGWIECEVEKDNIEREKSVGKQIYQACEEQINRMTTLYQEMEQQLDSCEKALIED